jgi:hypothetical protein
MLLKHIIKKAFSFLICIVLSFNLLAQNIVEQVLAFKEFIATGYSNSNSFFLIQAPAKLISLLENENQLSILRQLNDNTFIIKVNNKSVLLNFTFFYPANDNWKLSSELLNCLNKAKKNHSSSLLITVFNEPEFIKWATEKNIHYTPANFKNTFIITTTKKNIFSDLLQFDQVNFISNYNNQPKEELQINNLDLSINKINLLHSKMPSLNGTGLVVSIKENKPDSNDIDIKGRYISNPLAATTGNSHATIMATMAAGAGNSYYLGKGVAWGSAITSSSFSNLLPDADLNYSQNNITVQNHSYGVGVENFYGADASAFDASALTNDKLLFVFSAGNSGATTPATGNYAGITGVANLTGSFKMAKNIITVGAVDSFNNVVILSSKGPAYDGRIKPEMVAYGEDGSSGAAALVSGTAIVLQQAYKNNNGGNLPTAALVKSILLNSCDDVAAGGIDFTSGFGSLNAYKAAEGMATQKYFTGTVTNNGIQTFYVTIPPNTSKAKFTLVWNDVPANTNAFKAIKNDLDIQLKSIATSQVWLPWVLSSFPNKDSLQLLPVRKRDSLNTVEQISIDNPVAGNYSIIVNNFNAGTATQPFAIAYQFDTINIFNWNFPTGADNVFPAVANLVRWNSSFAATTAILDYSINNGSSWQSVLGNINLASKYFSWQAPDTTATALLRMTIGSQQFISDLFTISSKLGLGTGFNCADSALLYWNKNKDVSSYQLYSLDNKFLQPLSIISDTQFVFNKTALPYLNFAIAPVINNKTGVKSYTVNYTAQAVDCYVKNLLADLVNNNTADIKLAIGTTYLIKKIVFEKLINGNFSNINEINIISGLNYNFTDTHLQKAVNIYRVVIYLQTGKIIYSDKVSVIYFDNSDVLIYPNPVIQNNTINIQLKSLKNQTIIITDVSGRKILQKKLDSTAYSFIAAFTKGLYIITVTDPETKTVQFSKIVIQ